VSPRATPIDLYAVYARNENARRVLAGLAAATPALAEAWQQLDRALEDVPDLGAVVTRLSAELASAGLDRANLLAAIRAAIEADADGDADPLAYLRDELADQEARHGQEM
jgi:ABC-type transporter Mla subunit MlaD